MAVIAKTAENFSIDQGADFSRTLTTTTDGSTAYNITGLNIQAQIRKSYATTTITATFTCTIVSGTDGTYKLTLTDTQTAAIEPGRYLYDTQITLSDSTIEKAHHGIITVNESITRVSE